MSAAQPASENILPRSAELLGRRDSALLVIDVQEKLAPLVPGHARLVWNIRRLLDGARLLGVPTLATEQYPRGLGPTVPELAARLPAPPAKTRFSCAERGELFAPLAEKGVFKILVAGLETHVCVQQTVFDLMAAGYSLYVAADAVSARHAVDHEWALRRMHGAGAVITTTEAALFEWCETAQTPEFKELSKLAREPPPDPSTA